MKQESLQITAEQALAYAKKQGASQAEVALHTGTGLSISVREQQLESIEKHNDAHISITVYRGQKLGSASSADLSHTSVQATVDAALSIAQYTADDRCHGLADADLMASSFKDLQLYHPWELEESALFELARECEAVAMQFHPEIDNTEGATLDTYSGISLYANSHDFFSHKKGSQHSLSCSVIAKRGEQMQRDYWYDSNRNPALLACASSIGETAAQRAVARLGAKKISSTQAPVMFDATVAKSLFAHLFNAISGGKIYKKATFLHDKLGQKVCGDFIRVLERPHLVGATKSAVHDSEGVAIPAQREIVTDGVLQSYLLNSYTARKLNTATTGHAGGVRNVLIQGATHTREQLLQEMGTGLLLTELMGSSINYMTGDYSRGAAGFWVENGEIIHPVEEITIAGNVLDMLNGIRAIGTDADTKGNIHCGSVLIDKLTIAGS